MATSAKWDLDVTKQTVASAEGRARLQVKPSPSKPSRGNSRQYAQALHRQADELCQRGEPESALVLYHRAATVCPHDSNHSVAARRTAAMISSWSDAGRSVARLPASARNEAISRVNSCPGSAMPRAHDLAKSCDLNSAIPDILRYLDIRERTCREALPALGSLTTQLTRSRTMLKRVNDRADAILQSLTANFDAGKMRISLRLAEDLLTLSSDLVDPRRHKIPAYHHLSLIHAALGRHDRASNNIAALVHLSVSTKDVVILSRALVTLGKVHLTFGYLNAAARAWENVLVHVQHPILRAWLYHEIGRCHLEAGKYVEALRKAAQCREYAEEVNSKKWIFHAGLLKAQCLAMLGRFAEALEELRVTAKISEEEGDTPTLSYIRDLIEQLNRALRKVTFGESRRLRDISRGLSPCELHGRSEGNEAITTSGITGTARSKDEALTALPCCGCVEDKMLDRREIDEDSSSMDSATSFKSKKTSLTYVIESRTNILSTGKPDGTLMCDEELAELLSRESHTTFQTCFMESKYFVDEEKASTSFQPIEASYSNVETSSGGAECETLRMSRSCDDGRCSFHTTIDSQTRCDAVARSSDGYPLLPKAWRQNDEEKSLVCRAEYSG